MNICDLIISAAPTFSYLALETVYTTFSLINSIAPYNPAMPGYYVDTSYTG